MMPPTFISPTFNKITPQISKVRFGETPKAARETRALPRRETYSLHLRVRAFAAFSDGAVDSCGDNGQRYRAELILSSTSICAPEHMNSTRLPASYSIRST
jgi:hypothetical protein